MKTFKDWLEKIESSWNENKTPLSAEETRHIQMGNPRRAIKDHAARTGVSKDEAKLAVDAWTSGKDFEYKSQPSNG